jgi:tRNA-modifying protein YgfZ
MNMTNFEALPLNGGVDLTHWGVIQAEGPEAVHFLQGQLTQDFALLGQDFARLAGYCSPKGRLLASFIGFKPSAEQVVLVCHRSVLDATLKRLKMYVLRAKCVLTDVTGKSVLTGWLGQAAQDLGGHLPEWGVSIKSEMSVMRLPDVQGCCRVVTVSPADQQNSRPNEIALSSWQRLEVQSGIPMIEQPGMDLWVPQMINFEVVGGVNFKKGCYPGQEIVARSQYRGTLKRRMFLFEVPAAAHVAQEIFHSEDPGQPAGAIVNAVALDSSVHHSVVLAEVKLAALEQGTLHLTHPQGPALTRLPLPYLLPSNTGE